MTASRLFIFVFCTVPVPVKGLSEVGWVTKQDGDI
jgi:hypothetical protein